MIDHSYFANFIFFSTARTQKTDAMPTISSNKAPIPNAAAWALYNALRSSGDLSNTYSFSKNH